MFNLVESPLILRQSSCQSHVARGRDGSLSSPIVCSSPSPASASFPLPLGSVGVEDLQTRSTSAFVESKRQGRTGGKPSRPITQAASFSTANPSFPDSQNGVPAKKAPRNGAANRLPVEVSAKGKWAKVNDSSLSQDEPLPLPMTWPGSAPAPKEKVEEMLKCDPEKQNCKDVVYQWVGECGRCQGTGSVSFYRKRHEVVSKCINCLGIGSVHKITSRADIEDMDGMKGSANGFPRMNGKA